jgi:uncharacterized protein (DUF1015 family)
VRNVTRGPRQFFSHRGFQPSVRRCYNLFSQLAAPLLEAFMAETRPFRAFHYDTNRVRLDRALTQPYDKITPAMQEKYYAASPYNLISIERGRGLPGDTSQSNVYTRAAKTLNEWIAQKILAQDAAPNIYIYSQEFLVPGTQTRRTRLGFIALGRVEDYAAKIVFRHERTLSAPKVDRIELLRHTRAQTGQLFMLYDDPARKIEMALEEAVRKFAPAELADEFGVMHRLWGVADRGFAERIQNAMREKKLIIADGHHRYETALAYRDDCRARAATLDPLAAYEFAMMTFVNTHSRGLVILPTHRLLRNLPDFHFDKIRKDAQRYFDWYGYPFSSSEERSAAYAEFRKDLKSQSHGRRAIGIYAGGGAFYLFTLRRSADLTQLLPELSEAQRGLDVVLLHRLLLEKVLCISAEAVAAEKNVGYERETDAAVAAVDGGEAQVACLLNPVRVGQVTEIALAGDVLPQKSTDFYPKLLSGLAIYKVEGRVAE